MKSFLNCLIICGLVAAVGCSGNSPDAPSVNPPNGGNGGGDVYLITSLTASDDNPFVNTAILVTATVTLDGAAVPDGTNVEFIANGGVFPANGGTDLTVATTGGTASVQFGATDAGIYTIQARVKAVTAQIQIAYRNPDQSDALQIYNLNPASGSYFGGETVVITGKGIRAPAEVYFTVQGLIYQAVVDQVVPSVPASGSGTITIRTPEPTAADSTQTSAADVRVIVDVGATTQEEVTVPSGFVFIGNVEPPPNVPPTPVLFGVDPYYGRSQGGETVTILGMNFQWEPPTGGTEPTFAEVYFTFNGQDLLAQVERVSANQIEVITPRFSFTPLNDDTSAGVKLTRSSGSPVEKADVFIVKSDIAQPEITGISPTAGPLDGGTIVTIHGHGFQLPIQVAFGQLEATDVQLYDDQSLADNDVITCRTPDYSQQGQTPPLSVNVRVTNLQNGLSDTSDQVFTYGEILYITQANPTQGQIGDLLALYGAGFEDPLTVWFSNNIEFDVLSVTGTELTLRSPPDLAPTCADRTGDFRVVLNESGREATGASYTLLGSNPTITSVDPIFVQSTSNGNGVDPMEIDITGVRFEDELFVLVDNFTIDPSNVTVETPEWIHVSRIPAPNDFGLTFDTTSCTTQTGLQGVRQVPTAVDITVRNLPLGCDDTLAQTLVYVPEDQSCVVAPNLNVGPLAFPATPFPGPSAPQAVTIDNTGAGTLEVSGVFVDGPFFFDGGCSVQAAPGFTVPPFTNGYVGPNVYFCPPADDGTTSTGQLRLLGNQPNSPTAVNLSATEAFPILGVSTNTLTFGAAGVQSFTVTNTGTGNLTFSITETDPNDVFTVSPLNGSIAAGGAPVQIDVTNSGSGGDGSLEIVAGEADAQGSPQTVILDITY